MCNGVLLSSFSEKLIDVCGLIEPVSVLFHVHLSLIFQLGELHSVPATSEKAISEATARKEELEKQKVKEEEKLKEVMESLKEETSGLQQDKEVRLVDLCLLTHSSHWFLQFSIASLFRLSDQREGADGAQQSCQRN